MKRNSDYDSVWNMKFQLTSQRNQHRSSCNFSEDFTTIFDLENTRYCALPSREESYRLIPFVEESSVPIEDKMSNPKERQTDIRVEPNLVVEESEEQPQQSFANPEEEDDEEGFFEGFEVDEKKLKQVKETLFRLTQVQTQLITVVREGLSQEDPEIVVTEEEEEINSFLLWDTSDLLDEAERRWELTQARILSSYIVERESLPNNFNLLDPNRYSTPLLRPEGVEKDGVLENEQENIRITYQNSGSFEGFEPEEPPMIHGVERQIEIPTFGPYTPQPWVSCDYTVVDEQKEFQLTSPRNQHRSSCSFLKTSPPYLILRIPDIVLYPVGKRGLIDPLCGRVKCSY
ncbi:hypothetical protein Anas_06824 [Armadillidium nasatum]|uniref:Uncharacterized protein n=1 Tax=Armadillidium nasatum TaxID=96803 RepID=A0A5N5TBK6_9CRUS|nr:hypothetical protein Anas_06824 [Armadillidium nasatum]